MYIILGATGHVGAATARALLARQQPVTVVTRDKRKAHELATLGALVAEADVRDVAKLRSVFRMGTHAFLLNPTADPSTDTDQLERETVRCILEALRDSGLSKVVAASTYGARPGEACGDLTVLYELEQGLRAQSIPAVVQRAAYYMSNFDGLLEIVRGSGVLPTMFPEELQIPMVAPADVGRSAARLLMASAPTPDLLYVEGPARYSMRDVAQTFSELLDRPVQLEQTPREAWEESFRSMGFSAAAARSYACMTGTVVDGSIELPAAPLRGAVTLRAYFQELTRRTAAGKPT